MEMNHSLVGGRRRKAELGEVVFLLLNFHYALLRDHRLGHVLRHKLRVKVAQVRARLNLRFERRLDLLIQELLPIYIFKEWMSQDLVDVVLLTQTLFAVLLQEL